MIKDIIKKNIEFDAIFAWRDWIALEVISFLQEFNLKVPEDVSIVGFDNIRSNFFSPYKITSINYSSEVLVSKTLDILLEKISSPSLKSNEHIVIDTELIEGNNT